MSDSVDLSRVLERRLCFLSLVLVLLTVDVVVASVFALPARVLLGFNRDSVVFGLWSWTRVIIVAAIVIFLIAVTAVALMSVFSMSRHAYWAWRQPGSAAPLTTWITALASAVGVLLACGFALSIWSPNATTALFYFIRTANIWNGVSVLLPLMFLGIAALVLGGGELLRLNLLDGHVLTDPFLGFGGARSFAGVEDGERRIVDLLGCPAEELPNAALWMSLPLIIFLYLVLSGLRAVPIDGKFFAVFFGLVEMFVYTAFVIVFARFLSMWSEMRRLLNRLYFHPTRQSYEKLRAESLPPSAADQQTIRLYEPRTSLTAVEFCLQQARQLSEHLPLPETSVDDDSSAGPHTSGACVKNARAELSGAVVAAEEILADVLEAEAVGQWRDATALRADLQRAMARLSAKVVEIFEPRWRFSTPSSLATADSGKDPDSEHSLLETANLFVAARVVDFLRQVFPQMRSLVIIATSGLLAMMLAANTYPFPLRDTIGLVSWTVLLIVVAVTLAVFVQINRSRIVSMLSGNTPGQLSWDSAFVWHVLIFAVLPILTLLGTQLPYTLQRIFTWIGGILGGAAQ